MFPRVSWTTLKEERSGGILCCIDMLNRLRSVLYAMTKEDWMVAFFGASFFIGVWYALPMVNTITDVWPFGGGVLRAIEAHTLLPGYGVAYGTLSFYQNYFFMVLALGISYVALGFDAEALKTILILNPSYSLLVPRITSALTAVVLLIFVHRFLKTHVSSPSWRFALLILAFGNVLAAILARSGKMWMLSVGLGIVSFIYLYRALTEEAHGLPGRYAAVSVFAAFLATANFAFAALFLVTIPILLYIFPHTPDVTKRFFVIIVSGAAVFLGIFALNAANTIEQVSGFVLQFFNSTAQNMVRAQTTLTLPESFMVNMRQAVESFPLLLIALVPAVRAGVRDRVLANLAVIYIALYMIAVSIIFRSDDGLALNVRHVLPVGFFLLFLLAAFKPPSRTVAITFSFIGLAVYVYTLVLLSIPTTYNAVSDFIVNRYSNSEIRIDERIFELTLPMNKASYSLYATSSCGSTCQHMRTLSSDIAFKPIVVTNDADPAAFLSLADPDLIIVEHAIAGCAPLASFGNNASDVFDIDINLGRMLLPSFYTLHKLGKDVYVYETKECGVNP